MGKCPNCSKNETIEHNGGQWCPNCSRFVVPPTQNAYSKPENTDRLHRPAQNVYSKPENTDHLHRPAQNAYGKRENTDHLPYCTACKKFVSPQVVASNKTASGITINSPDGLSSTRLHSSTKFHKFCPNCGNEVFSKRDLDESRSNAQQGCLVVAAALPLVFYAAARVVVYIL